MNAHDHAAQLAEALRDCSARLNDCVQVQPQTDGDPGGFMSQWDYDADYSVRRAQAALAAWDKHNAPAPKRFTLTWRK